MIRRELVIYVHGKGGTASEAEHYAPFFPDGRVIGFDYRSETPWQATEEFSQFFDTVSAGADEIYLIANSIGAYFSLCALAGKRIKKAYFISPVVDMEKLISDMMTWANVSEEELKERKEIPTPFGETLSWKYLSWAREHPVKWDTPTDILYGENDGLQSMETIGKFAEKSRAAVTVMKNGEHWFHTDAQMAFLDDWLRRKQHASGTGGRMETDFPS